MQLCLPRGLPVRLPINPTLQTIHIFGRSSKERFRNGRSTSRFCRGVRSTSSSFLSLTSSGSSDDLSSMSLDLLSSFEPTLASLFDVKAAVEGDSGSVSNFWEPIYLSALAGASTCIGASVAFLVPRESSSAASSLPDSDENDNMAVVGPELLSFSLAMAGSVMITVCLASILPESLAIEPVGSMAFGNSELTTTISSEVLLRRAIGFLSGWGVYLIISQWLTLLPDEDNWGAMLSLNGGTSSNEQGKQQSDIISSSSDITTSTSIAPVQFVSASMTTAMETAPTMSMTTAPKTVTTLKQKHCGESLQVGSNNESNSSSTQKIININSIDNEDDDEQSSSQYFQAIQYYDTQSKQKSPWRLTLLLFLSLLLHNFPEGLAVAFSAASSSAPNVIDSTSSLESSSSSQSSLGSIVTLSIALHNIPEGIAIAIPCMAARPNEPWLAFLLASLSGLAEPLGAFVALIFLRSQQQQQHQIYAMSNNPYIDTDATMGDALSFVAGIMMAVALCELIPEANRQRKQCSNVVVGKGNNKYDFGDERNYNNNPFMYGTILGVVIMILTEAYLGG